MLRTVSVVLAGITLTVSTPGVAQQSSEADSVVETAMNYANEKFGAGGAGGPVAIGVAVNDERRGDVEARVAAKRRGVQLEGGRLNACRGNKADECVPSKGQQVVLVGISASDVGGRRTVRVDHYARVGERFFKQSLLLEVSRSSEGTWFVSRELMHEIR